MVTGETGWLGSETSGAGKPASGRDEKVSARRRRLKRLRVAGRPLTGARGYEWWDQNVAVSERE
jgi:hypothetical protein